MSNLETFKKQFVESLEKEIQLKKNKLEKKELNKKNDLGLDKVIIDIPIEAIKSKEKEFIHKNDPYFNSLIAKYYRNTWYCRLDVNLPKFIFENNMLNISNGEELREVIIKIENYINERYKIVIDLRKSKMYALEINKYINLNFDFEEYWRTLLQINKYLVKGHFKKKFSPYKEWGALSYYGFGSKDKYISLYDKALEMFEKKFGVEELEKLSPKEIKLICKKYKTPIRIEIKLRKDCLWGLIPREIKIEEYINDFDEIISKTYLNVITSSGLAESNFFKVRDERVQRMVRYFEKIRKEKKRGFIGEFLKRHSFESEIKDSMWSLTELLEVVEKVSENKIQKYDWKKLMKKEFFRLDYHPKIEEKIVELMRKIEL